MAIKTIKNPRKALRRVITCNNSRCSAVLEVGYEDGKPVSDQRDGDAVDFQCPHCNTHIFVAAGLFWEQR